MICVVDNGVGVSLVDCVEVKVISHGITFNGVGCLIYLFTVWFGCPTGQTIAVMAEYAFNFHLAEIGYALRLCSRATLEGIVIGQSEGSCICRNLKDVPSF